MHVNLVFVGPTSKEDTYFFLRWICGDYYHIIESNYFKDGQMRVVEEIPKKEFVFPEGASRFFNAYAIFDSDEDIRKPYLWDAPENEEKMKKKWDSLPDDSLITVYDVHI